MNPVTKPDRARLIRWLDEQVARFEQPAFIENDPISVPYAFEDPQDRAIIGFFAASLAWGQRKTTLNKMAELCERMAYRPMKFVYDFRIEKDAATLKGFKHRTFTEDDAYWMVLSLSVLIRKYGGIEHVFRRFMTPNASDVGPVIQGFSSEMMYAVSGIPARLQKHLARPDAGSACKRLNMFLRWMVRTGSVDFGIWKGIRSDQLVMPLDVHVGRVARQLGMLFRPTNDWKSALELTEFCRILSPHDPVRYDFALFGWGVSEKNGGLPNLMLPE